jgi:predicted SAM-dependent methyltransferase
MPGVIMEKKTLISTDEYLKLNLGCGTTAPPGWINIDSSPNALLAKVPGHRFIKNVLYRLQLISSPGYNAEWPPDVLYCNLAKKFPRIPPVSCSVIYSSHFLEHIPRDSAANLINKCYIALKPEGVFRVAVPDLYAEAKSYVTRFETALRNGREDFKAGEDLIRLMVSRSRRHSHKWMYDFLSLSRLLGQYGFVDIEQREFQQSQIENIASVEKVKDSLFVECRKR